MIAEISLFKGLEANSIRELAEISTIRKEPQGTMIFHEGEPAEGLFCIHSGWIRLYKASPQGKEFTVHQFGPGETFAEVVAFSGAEYPVNAEVVEDAVLLYLPRVKLRDVIARDPDSALAMLGLMAGRLREFTTKLEQLGLKEVPARLASYFLLLSENAPNPDAIELTMPKRRLASYLGTIPETLSRCLNRLSEAGFITVNGTTVHLNDHSGLKSVALGEIRV